VTNLVAMTSNAPGVPPSVRRPRATNTSSTHVFRDSHFRKFWPRPTILRHDPGLAASPPVRYMLKWKGEASFPFTVRCRRTSPFAKRRRAAYGGTAGPARGSGVIMHQLQ
jgi:hypothetical protein